MDYSRAYVINEQECLSQNKAIKEMRWDCFGRCKIRYDGRLWITRINIKHIAPRNGSAIAIAIRTVFDFKHVPSNVLPMFFKKTLDVVTINWRATIESPPIT